MFGRDGAPDNTGGAFRLGYGISDSFDLEAKGSVFDGATLLGGDGHVRVFDDGNTLASFTFGGHRALVDHALDSTALDLAAALSQRLSSRVEVYGGAAFSWDQRDRRRRAPPPDVLRHRSARVDSPGVCA